MFRRARGLLGHEEDAKDALQEVFCKAMLALPGEREGQLPWLYRVTTNECLGMLRKRRVRRHVGLDEAPVATASDPGDPLSRTQVLRVLNRVDRKSAELAVYAYVDGMTTEEIARVAGVNRKTVGKRLERFRAQARRILGA